GCGERGGCGLVGAWFGAAEVAGLGADGTRRAGGRAALRGHRVGAGTVAVAVDGVAADRTTGACRRTRRGHGDGYASWYGGGNGDGYGHRQFWRAAFPRGSAPGPGAAAVPGRSAAAAVRALPAYGWGGGYAARARRRVRGTGRAGADRKSTRLNSSHVKISYAVFCLKKKTR